MVYSTEQFTYIKAENTLVAELSDLDNDYSKEYRIQSHVTGKIVTFEYDYTERRDGEVLSWNYKSVTPGVSTKLIIFND